MYVSPVSETAFSGSFLERERKGYSSDVFHNWKGHRSLEHRWDMVNLFIGKLIKLSI